MQFLREIINEIAFINFCNEHHVLQHMQHICTAFTEKLSPSGCLQVFPQEEKLRLFTQLSNASNSHFGLAKESCTFLRIATSIYGMTLKLSLVIVPDQKKIGDTMTLALKLVFNLQIRNRFQLHLSKGVTSETSISFHERKQKYIYDIYHKRHLFFPRNT